MHDGARSASHQTGWIANITRPALGSGGRFHHTVSITRIATIHCTAPRLASIAGADRLHA